MLTILLVAAAGIAGLYLLLGRDEPAPGVPPTPAPVQAPSGKPAELPCIDERCAPRPERLNCLRRDGSPASCVEWQVIWEDRCQCIERATRKDAGTP